MNQNHIQQQHPADAYEIGGPSEFAEDASPAGPGWKADLGSDGNTKRDEIGLPEVRKDTFDTDERAPGVSPSRQASVEQIHARAEVATKVARLMLSSTASERAIENQALTLMDLPLANLKNTLTRLAQDQGQDDEDEDEDEGQDKQASDDQDDEDDGQQKQAGELPPEFLEQQKKMKDKAKNKDDDKGQDKEARRRLRAQQQDDEDDDGQQQKQARRVKGQDQQAEDEDDDGQQQKQARRVKGQQQDDDDDGQQKQARRVKAQQQDDADEDDQQQKQARRRVKAEQQQDDEDEGQQKQAADQDDDEKKQAEQEKQVGKEAYQLIKQAASDLLAIPTASRAPVFKAMLPSLVKVAAYGMQRKGQQQQGQDQIMAQVQQLVQQAMQQQSQQPQQAQQQPQLQAQQQLGDQELVDQMLQEPAPLAEDQIQLDAPEMDLGLGGEEDPALQAIFASDSEVQLALEAREIERGHHPTAGKGRTASTRTVGTRPSAGVSQLGGSGSSGASSGGEEINRLASMWASAPDVSNVFRS